MKLDHLDPSIKQLRESNIAARVKDPKAMKQLRIAFTHDSTIPRHLIAQLGPNPEDEAVVKLWGKLIDDTLSQNDYGDLSADSKFDEWLLRQYINGVADYEDINGEGGDALGVWKALSTRGLLKPADQDFNKFKSIKQLQRIRNDRDYRDKLARIKDAEKIEKLKREAKQINVIDDERFRVMVPFNFGSCYSNDRGEGYIPNFCTSSSSGHDWFERYAPNGMIVNITDKANIDSVDGKWQFHAATNQIVRGDQDRRHDRSYNDERFAQLFPGLMKKIIAAIQANSAEINEQSKSITGGVGYDVAHEIDMIKSKYPQAANSDAPEPTATDEVDGAGTWVVTHTESGRVARIQGDNKADVKEKLLARHPNLDLNDFTFELQQEEEQ